MSGRRLAIVIVCTLLAMALLAWLGHGHRAEAIGFLRALVRMR